jgi:sodium-coupled monocarboxylate transporter 8/12
MATGKIKRVDAIVPYFVSTELTLPGMMGLFTACVFSASLSTLSSGLNSLAAVLFEDFLKHHEKVKNLSPAGQAHLVRFLAMLFGAVSIALAFVAQNMGSMLAATITAMGALSGPLGAVFAMGLLMPCVNRYGAIAGMTTGFCCMVWLTTNAFMLGKSHIPLPFSADDCPSSSIMNGTSISGTMNVTDIPTLGGPEELEWPEKLYTVSYILYPFVGGMITFATAIVISIVTGGCCRMRRVEDKYLHPLLHRKGPQLKASITRKASFESHNVDHFSVTSTTPKPSLYPRGYHVVRTEDEPFNRDSYPETPGSASTTSSQKPLLYRLPSYKS